MNRLADPPAVRDRADRPLLRARRPRQAAAGRGSTAASRLGEAIAGFFADLREDADVSVAVGRAGSGARRARRRAGTARRRRRRCASRLGVDRRQRPAARLHDRAHAQVQIDADRRSYSPRRASGSSTSSARRERMPADGRRAPAGRASTCSCPSFTGHGEFDARRCRAAPTSSSRRRATSTRSTTAPCRSPSTSAGTIFYSRRARPAAGHAGAVELPRAVPAARSRCGAS